MPNKKKHHGEDFNGYQLTGLPTPSADTDAATKLFVLQNAGGSPLASTVSYTPITGFPTAPNNPADTVQKAVDNLFTLANSGKSAIAGAIGSPAASTNSFTTLAGYVTTAKTVIDAFVDKAEGTTDGTETLAQLTTKLDDVRIFQQKLNLKKAAGSTTTIQLASPYPSADKLCVTPCIRVDDAAQTNVTHTFNNGEEGDFVIPTNSSGQSLIEFSSSVARLRNSYSSFEIPVSANVSEYIINASKFEEYKELTLSGNTLNYIARPTTQVLVASASKQIANSLLDITQTQPSFTGSGPFVYAMSFDDGVTWYGNKNNVVGGWQQIFNINDATEFQNKATFRTKSIDVLSEIRSATGNSYQIKFAYLIGDTSYTNKTLLDKMEMDLVFSGSFVPYGIAGYEDNANPSFEYNASNGVITVNHPETDAYLINYIDKASAVT